MQSHLHTHARHHPHAYANAYGDALAASHKGSAAASMSAQAEQAETEEAAAAARAQTEESANENSKSARRIIILKKMTKEIKEELKARQLLPPLSAPSLNADRLRALADGSFRFPPPPYESRGVEADAAPPADAAAGVRYCSFPDARFQHFAVGSDGSAFNQRTGKWIQPRIDASSKANPTWIQLSQMTDGNIQQRGLTRAEAVLLSHGWPRPSPHAAIRYHDGDNTNDALSNLYWETAEE
jgi:hypothetical protein